MALESGKYINQLVEANPDGLDPKSQGDDHIRLIKRVLKATFPNISEPVTSTAPELNAATGTGSTAIKGQIMMWFGQKSKCPAGWAICDGTRGTPNLSNRTIFGAASDSDLGSTGGSFTHTHSIFAHMTTTTVNGTAITLEQVPGHTHPVLTTTDASQAGHVTVPVGTPIAANPNGRFAGFGTPLSAAAVSSGSKYITKDIRSNQNLLQAVGSSQPHSHSAQTSGTTGDGSTLPPYVAIYFIMKL